MKLKLKPWQIGLIVAAGVVVLGGAGVGIYFGVNRAIDNKVKDQIDAALESVYSSEAALDESEIPTQTAGETDTAENTTVSQPTKEPETVLVYVAPTETNRSNTPDAPEPQPQPNPEEDPEIEFVYDAALTDDLVQLIEQRYPRTTYLPASEDEAEKLFERARKKLFRMSGSLSIPVNYQDIFAAEYSQPSAEAIFADWTCCALAVFYSSPYDVRVYRSNSDWIFVTLDFLSSDTAIEN